MSSTICQLLSSPSQLASLYPIPDKNFIEESRETSARILQGEDKRIALLVGPCSIHDTQEALEYGRRLKQLQSQLSDSFFLIMRVFLEKPRSRMGWKGMVYDPFLDGSNHLEEGLTRARSLLAQLNELSIPCSTEFLDPLIAPYLSDLITWGMIGARTAASQPHRQLASGLPFPVGFKNGIHGELDIAVNGIASAQISHTHFSLDPDGRISSLHTTGNPLAHLVLRGSETKPNCDPQSVAEALALLRKAHLPERLAIDCAHGNSGKNLARQKAVFEQTMGQIRSGNSAIRAIMLESYLHSGNQTRPLLYGTSITDPCLSWEETQELLLSADRMIKE